LQEDGESIIVCGEGNLQETHQTMTQGNLAVFNCLTYEWPVRVIVKWPTEFGGNLPSVWKLDLDYQYNYLGLFLPKKVEMSLDANTNHLVITFLLKRV